MIFKRPMQLLAVIVSAFGFVLPAFAWNDRGHMLAAMVAYQELKPEVRKKVLEILKAHPQRDLLEIGGPKVGRMPITIPQDTWLFARACTWPDLIRKPDNPLNAAEHNANWHYVSYPIGLGKVTAPKPVETWDGKSEPVNILQAIQKNAAELGSDKTAPDRRAFSLCWTMHLVSDLHQPLHAVSFYSHQFPDGDRGGNLFAVRRGDSYMSLHSYWDNLLGASTQLYDLHRQVDSWMADPAMSRKALLKVPTPPTTPLVWAQESYKLAWTTVYRQGALRGEKHTEGDFPKTAPALPSDYEETAKKVAAKQVAIAGYRLADELNKAFANPISSKSPGR